MLHCPACSGCHYNVPAVAPKAGNSQKRVGTDWKMHLLFAILFLLGSIEPEKGKSPGEDGSVFMPSLEPLEGFLGFFQFLGCCRADLHG